ncbi:MAG: MoaD/ThiS family protein [Gammaproteobacteria bacterium]|nr:MoaD/ThiS family protein [Gammaproteobacteria bacterium]
MRVLIPHALRSYTGQRDQVSAQGETLDDLLWDLDRKFPGMRFRMIDEQDQIRRHVVIFVKGAKTTNLAEPLADSEEVVIVQALSGG